MTDTKELLKKISALRQRLDQAQGLANAAAVSLIETEAQPIDPLQALHRKVQTGAWETSLLDGAMRPLPDPTRNADPVLPSLLTARGVRLLKRGKELLQEMRELADATLSHDENDPPAVLHRELVAMTDSVVRTVQAFPSAPSAQMRLCEGLEETLAVVDEKLSILKSGLNLRGAEEKRINFLAEVLTNALTGSPNALSALKPLALELISEAKQGYPLRFLHASPERPDRHVAAHSLTVAQVMCRLLLRDPEWQGRLEEPVLVALLHDVGMVAVPAEILAQRGALNDDQRRVIEKHTVRGAEIAARLWPAGGWPVDAIADHHERIDGTGYPHGRLDQQLAGFSRLLAVCDVYAALASPRPYRAALDSRTALTDTLLLADQGALDRSQAERLLTLSFFPVGSVVEVSDGCLGVVVANNPCQNGHAHPAKPVVAILTDPHGLPLPIPRHVDLSLEEGRSVLRNLPAQERRHLMLKRYPELA